MMDQTAIDSRLSAAGLRIPALEMPAFAGLVQDMESAATIARRPLYYTEEPSTVLRLQPAA